MRLLFLSPIALLAVAFAVWLIGRTISRSLEETTLAAEAIADGETGQRVPVRGTDELGRLARSFNSMAQQIEDSQRAMREVNASLRTMLDGAPLPIIVLDTDDRVRMWNRAAERTLGWRQDEVIAEPLALVDPTGHPIELPTGAEGVRGVELRMLNKSGQALDLMVAVAPTYSATGQVDGLIVACDDITARKQAEEQLERYAEELARSNAELENFAYVASHDLREPLRMVRSFTGLLSDRYSGALDEEAERYIEFARDGAQRMEELIKALLEYSRVDGEKDPPLPVESHKTLDEALQVLAPAIRESGAVVTFDGLPDVVAHRGQVMRVFQNLVGNAIKFRGAEPPRVHVSAERQGDEWVFAVRDNGIGIDPAYHERIFQIFKRLHGLNEYSGTGMGLSICKKIVESHGGTIWVDSEEGRGSCFYFTLPAATAAAVA